MKFNTAKLLIFSVSSLIASAVSAHSIESTKCIDSLNSKLQADSLPTVTQAFAQKPSFDDSLHSLQSTLNIWIANSNDKSIGLSQKFEADRAYRPRLNLELKVALSAISSAEQYRQLLFWIKSDLLSFKTVRVRDLLKEIDFASSLTHFRDDLDANEKSKLLSDIASVPNDRWQSMLPAFQIALEPQFIFSFVDNLPNSSFINSSEKGVLGPSFYTAMTALPKTIKKDLASQIAQHYSNISKDDEAITQLGRFTIRGPKVVKRNLEIVYRFLFEHDLKSLIQTLPSASTKLEMLASVNRYISTTTSGLTGGGRGNYDFSLVLNVAKQLQSHLQEHLDDRENYIQLYGSFPNGKANLLSSDVDVHLSDRMSEAFLSPYTNFQTVFMDLMANAENPIAEALGQLHFEKGKLVTYIVESPSVSAERRHGVINNFAEYNPIVVKILKGQISIQIFDATTQELHEFKIPSE